MIASTPSTQSTTSTLDARGGTREETPMQIGFIGLGTMGAYMASNLQQAGFMLVVNDVDKGAAKPHLAAGAGWADTPNAVGQACELVFASLPGPREVEAVTVGKNGLIAGMKPGAAFFDLTTNSPSVVRRLHGLLAEKGIHMLDSPVSGGPQGAKSRRLALWVGGDKAQFEKWKPQLDAIGDAPRWIGAIGAGSVAKLVHNCAGYAIQAALAEVMSMGVKGGVEPLALWEAVRTGALGRRRTFDGLADQFLVESYEPPSFALRLAHKDMFLATELGRELGVPMRLANIALADMTEAMNRGWAEKDSRSPMALQVERAGVKIKVEKKRIADAFERDPPFKGDPKR
jgi:3-hydroxyisobutyrate dehydrogenase